MLHFNFIKKLKRNVFKHCTKFLQTAFSNKYLFVTNVGISFTLSGTGDFLEQHYEILAGKLTNVDKKRVLKMALTGITVGIFTHHYYNFLEKKFPGKTPSNLIKKIIIDQTMCSPMCIAIFLMTVAYLEDLSMSEFVGELKSKYLRLYAAEWIVWPPAQFINFYLLPPRYRVLYDSIISLGYDIYTSYVNHDKSHEVEER